jgi:integrase
MLPTLPKIDRPKRVKGSKMMKGRPITREEFERMLAKVESVVGMGSAPAWSHYLEGLWLSGLRLAESLELYWDRDDKICVDLERRRPMLRVRAELEKGNQDRLLPITPDFAAFLESTPKELRTGPVFNPTTRDGKRPTEWWVSRTVSKIGEAATVKVDTKPVKGDNAPTVKYASAHDLRRSFGERWSTKVMPQVLMQLMRHESMETTNKFYVGRNADAVADAVWATVSKTPPVGNIRGNNGYKTPNDDQSAAVRNTLSHNDDA